MAASFKESEFNLTPVVCRLGTAAIPQLTQIEQAHQPVPWSEKLFLDEFAQSNSLTYGARMAGELCGYVVFRIFQDEAHILNLCVVPEVRRCGIGTVLIEETCRALHRVAVKWCSLEVRVSNLRAQKLYEKCGFHEVGRRRGYYQENNEDALILKVSVQDLIDERGIEYV